MTFSTIATRDIAPVWEDVFPTAVFAGVTEAPFKQLYMAMSTQELITATRLWMVVWSDPRDRRGMFFRSFKGWIGQGNALEWHFIDGTVSQATNDHQYHMCVRWHRRWCGTLIARDAAISILIGENRQTWARYNTQ